MTIGDKNVQTGKTIQRERTQAEIDAIAATVERERPEREKVAALTAKKNADVAALGTRAELLKEIDDLIGVSPKVKALLKKLANITYTNEKNTVD